MRQTLLIYLLVLSCTAIAQTSSHELKTDLFLPSIFNTAHLAYEYSPNGRISFEAGMFFTWTHALLSIMPEAYDPSNPKHQLIEWNIENKNARQYFGTFGGCTQFVIDDHKQITGSAFGDVN